MSDRRQKADTKAEIAMLDKIASDTKFGDLPEVLVENEAHHLMQEIEDNLTRQGGKMEDYLKSLGKTRNEFVLDLLPNAVKRVKTALVMKEIGTVEKIAASEHEVSEKIADILKDRPDDQELKKLAEQDSYKRYVANVLENEKVLQKLKEWNYASAGNK
jgi:trigger factor